MASRHLLDSPHTAHPSPGNKDPQNSALVPSRRLSSSPRGSLLLLREHLLSDSSLTHCPQHRGHISTGWHSLLDNPKGPEGVRGYDRMI